MKINTSKLTKAGKKAKDNMVDFFGKLEVESLPSSVKISETKDSIIVQWNTNDKCIFFSDGSWEIKKSTGLYPSGAGHYTEHVNTLLTTKPSN